MLSPDQFSFVICAQALTGRLEVLESFFTKRFKEVFIIGISSIFAKYNSARCTVYKNGNKYSENKLFNLIIKRNYPFKGLFFFLAYGIYFVTALFSILRLRAVKKKLIFIGVGCFPALLGIIFRQIRACKKGHLL